MNFRGGKYVDYGLELAKKFRYRSYVALNRLGFKIRATAQAEIQDEKGPSDPGQPPHTHKRHTTKSGKASHKGLLPASILYGLDKETMSVVIGPSEDLVGTSMTAMEHGGPYKGHDYEPRPFMAPALKADIGELPGLIAEEYGKV